MKRTCLTALALLVLLIAVRAEAAEPKEARRREIAALRFEQADLSDLLTRLRRQRGRVSGVWAKVMLTAEIITVQVRLREIEERLAPPKAETKFEDKPAEMTYEPPALKKPGDRGRKRRR